MAALHQMNPKHVTEGECGELTEERELEPHQEEHQAPEQRQQQAAGQQNQDQEQRRVLLLKGSDRRLVLPDPQRTEEHGHQHSQAGEHPSGVQDPENTQISQQRHLVDTD